MKLSKKILPLAMAALMAFQAVPVYAAVASSSSKRKSTPLTVKEATSKAVTRMETLRQTKESLPISEESYKEIQDAQRLSTTDSQWLNYQLQLMQMDMSNAISLSSIEAMEENMEFAIISLFSAIVSAEKELELYNEKVDLASRELNILKTKMELGLASQLEYETEKANYENMVNTRIVKQNVIDSAYRSLNETMGQKLENRYIIELDFEYEDIGNVNLTTHVSKFINRSINVKSAQEKVKIAEYNLSEVATTLSAVSVNDYDTQLMQKEVDLAQAKRAVQTAKDNVETTVKDTYTTIMDLEANYKNAVLGLETLQRNLEVMEVQYELGQITQLDLDNYKYTIKETEETIRKLAANHEMLKIQFNSPNLLVNGTGASAGGSGGASQ